MGALAHCDDGVDLLASPVAMTVADHEKEKGLTALPVKATIGVRHSKRRQGRRKPMLAVQLSRLKASIRSLEGTLWYQRY